MSDFKYLYLKYKNKYVTLKNQHGGIKCHSEYFTQHKGECWHDSIQTLLLFNNDIGDRIQYIIKSKTTQEILVSPKKYQFLLPINLDYNDDFSQILSKYITDMILRFENKICTIKPPELKRSISFTTGISTAIDALKISDIKKEPKNKKRINTLENHGGSVNDNLIVLQTINYFFQDDTNKFINAVIYYEFNINEFNISLLNKLKGIIINTYDHAICLFKCGDTYMLYDDNSLSDIDPTMHAKEFNWYSLIRDNILIGNTSKLLDIILTEIKKISREYYKRYSAIFNIICIYEDTFNDENDYYFKLLNNYNYFDDYYNTDSINYVRLYKLLENDNILNMIINKYYLASTSFFSSSTIQINQKDLDKIKLSLKNPKIIPEIFRTRKYKLEMFSLYSKEIRNNEKLIIELANIYDGIIKYISDDLKNDKEFIKDLVRKVNVRYLFQYISDDLKNDKEFIKDLVRINYNTYDWLPKELKSNREFIGELIEINYKIFNLLPYGSINKSLIEELVCINPKIIKIIPKELKKDTYFMEQLHTIIMKTDPDRSWFRFKW